MNLHKHTAEPLTDGIKRWIISIIGLSYPNVQVRSHLIEGFQYRLDTSLPWNSLSNHQVNQAREYMRTHPR